MSCLSFPPDPYVFVRRSCVNPFNKIYYIRMREQLFHGTVVLLQFLLGKHGMDETMAG